MSARASTGARLASSALARAAGAPRLALGHGLLGTGALAAAPALGAGAWLALWLAASHFALAYAYAVNRPAVFGKRPDGTLAPLSTALLLPYLLFVWGFFALKLAGLRREPCAHRVGERLYLGRRPRAGEVPPECDLVVDLTAEFPADRALASTRAYRCLPTLNRHAPQDADFIALLTELLAWDGGVYVHCGAGRGRSAMVAAALLVLRSDARDTLDAERILRAVRPGVRLHPAQKAVIDRCCRALRAGAAQQSPSASGPPTYVWSAPQARPARMRR
jgi:protein-tyrosine phosphatase